MFLDVHKSTWGLHVFDASIQEFVHVRPIVITNSSDITTQFYPLSDIGNVGDYAVVPHKPNLGYMSKATFFYKSINGWVIAGTPDWKKLFPTVVGKHAPKTLPENSRFRLSLNDNEVDIDVVVPYYPNNTVQGICDIINARNISNLVAHNDNGKIVIVFGECGKSKFFTLNIVDESNLLSLLGLSPGKYYIPEMVYSTDIPQWKGFQESPHPTGSLWVNLNDDETGLQLKVYDNDGIEKHVYKAIGEGDIAKQIDVTGGGNIPIGTLYARVNPETNTPYGGVVIFERINSGPTVVRSSIKNPTLSLGKMLEITVTLPDRSRASPDIRTITTTGTTINSFVNDWESANIQHTKAEVVDGYLQITHTLGGDILLADYQLGHTNGLLNELGFIPYSTENVRYGPCYTYTTQKPNQYWTSGNGRDAVLELTTKGTAFITNHVVNPGAGYKIGDIIQIRGTDVGGDAEKNDVKVSVQHIDNKGGVWQFGLYSGVARVNYTTILSYWKEVEYTF